MKIISNEEYEKYLFINEIYNNWFENKLKENISKDLLVEAIFDYFKNVLKNKKIITKKITNSSINFNIKYKDLIKDKELSNFYKNISHPKKYIDILEQEKVIFYIEMNKFSEDVYFQIYLGLKKKYYKKYNSIDCYFFEDINSIISLKNNTIRCFPIYDEEIFPNSNSIYYKRIVTKDLLNVLTSKGIKSETD